MKEKNLKTKQMQFWLWAVLPTICALLIIVQMPQQQPANAWLPQTTRRVNAPYNVELVEHAIFWFGQVDAASNYANVRIGYDDDELIVHLHIFDRRLWYDTSPSVDMLTAWDATSLFLSLDGPTGDIPDNHDYRFVAQFAPDWQTRSAYQAAYQGNGADWSVVPASFVTAAGWRGQGLNDTVDDRGWWVRYNIPFTTVGLTSKPEAGTYWGIGLQLHDRDDAAGASLPDHVWPETFVKQSPATWGELHFGLPGYVHPPAGPGTSVVIRQGSNGVTVMDAHVGGHSTCGEGLDFWHEWGETNYAGSTQINVQNQWDVADWPCYSRYYVTFPLDSIPAGDKVIRQAKLTLFQFGNAGQGWNPGPIPSLIQVLSVADEWDEADINWNNAPLAVENFSATWVDPIDHNPPWPGIPIEWDVSQAVGIAYNAGEPLKLALYSADSAYHSGRYFYSSDAGEAGRPMLEVEWADPLEVTTRLYLPLVDRGQ